MADALLMRMSMEPKRSTVALTAASQLSASRTSITIARPLPPAFSIAVTASWIVPGSFGFGSLVLLRR